MAQVPHAVSSQLCLELFQKACLQPMRSVGVGAPVSGKHGGIVFLFKEMGPFRIIYLNLFIKPIYVTKPGPREVAGKI